MQQQQHFTLSPSSSTSSPERRGQPSAMVEADIEMSEMAGYFTAESDFTDVEEKMEFQEDEGPPSLSSSILATISSPTRLCIPSISEAELEERLKQELALLRSFDR